MLDHLKNNMGDLNDLNEQLSSGKLFQRPSDAPIKVSDSMNYKSQLNRNSQFQRNLNQAENWLNTTESALNNGTKVTQRARELTIYVSSDTLTADDREKVASEIKELRDELIDISRAKLGDNHIFSGQKTETEPFSTTDEGDGEISLSYEGDSKDISRRLNENVEMDINLTGDKVFEKAINSLNDFYDDLNLDDGDNAKAGEKISNRNLSDIEESINNFVEYRAEIGGRLKRIDNMKSRLEANEVHIKQLKSNNEDADLAEVITNLKMEENVYRASLASGARIMQQSLVDFIR
jgi:flagellar hook-associated protein 3 FlgL